MLYVARSLKPLPWQIAMLVAFWTAGCASRAVPPRLSEAAAPAAIGFPDALSPDREPSFGLGAETAGPGPIAIDVPAAAPGGADKLLTLLNQPLGEDAAVQIALSNNRGLRSRLLQLGIARGALTQARTLPNPQFEVELLPEQQSDLGLRLEYNITGMILAPAKRTVAAGRLEAQRLSAAAEVVSLGWQVRLAFYAMQAAQQKLALSQRSLDALAAARDAADAMLKAGNLPPLVAAQHAAAFERDRLEVAALELAVVEAREKMARLLGLSSPAGHWTEQVPLQADSNEAAVPESIETEALQASLALQAVESYMQSTADGTRYARLRGWMPDVTVDGHALRGTPTSSQGQPFWRFGAGVLLSLPLFDRQQGNREAYEAQFDALQERRSAMAVEIRSRARQLRSQLMYAAARLHHYHDLVLPSQRRVFEKSQLHYNAMQLGIFSLLEARRKLLQAELGHVDALQDYWTQKASMAALLAGGDVASAAPQVLSVDMPDTEALGGQ